MYLRLREWRALEWVGFVLSLPPVAAPSGAREAANGESGATVCLSYSEALTPAYATLGWDVPAPFAESAT